MTEGADIRKRDVLVMYLGTLIASVVNILLFFVVTVYFSDKYIDLVGRLIHENVETNKALLHLSAQALH